MNGTVTRQLVHTLVWGVHVIPCKRQRVTPFRLSVGTNPLNPGDVDKTEFSSAALLSPFVRFPQRA